MSPPQALQPKSVSLLATGDNQTSSQASSQSSPQTSPQASPLQNMNLAMRLLENINHPETMAKTACKRYLQGIIKHAAHNAMAKLGAEQLMPGLVRTAEDFALLAKDAGYVDTDVSDLST